MRSKKKKIIKKKKKKYPPENRRKCGSGARFRANRTATDSLQLSICPTHQLNATKTIVQTKRFKGDRKHWQRSRRFARLNWQEEEESAVPAEQITVEWSVPADWKHDDDQRFIRRCPRCKKKLQKSRAGRKNLRNDEIGGREEAREGTKKGGSTWARTWEAAPPLRRISRTTTPSASSLVRTRVTRSRRRSSSVGKLPRPCTSTVSFITSCNCATFQQQQHHHNDYFFSSLIHPSLLLQVRLFLTGTNICKHTPVTAYNWSILLLTFGFDHAARRLHYHCHVIAESLIRSVALRCLSGPDTRVGPMTPDEESWKSTFSFSCFVSSLYPSFCSFFSFSFSLSLRLFPVSIWGLIIQPRSCDSQRYISLHPSVSFLVNVFMNLSAPTESGFTTFHFANQSTRAAFLITLNTRIQKGTKKKKRR